jgi:gliding motility-associated-like protein
MNKYALLIIVWIFAHLGNAQITTSNNTFTVDELVDGVLFEGGCTPITNIQSNTGTGVNRNGIAYFQANGTSFPIEDGIILSTGNALNANGPNDLADSSDNILSGNDTDLENIMAAAGFPLTSIDATWISFDFTPVGNFISFDYLFASEEYDGFFECAFADAFAFILTDSITGDVTNLATIPGSAIPVQVITVRDPPISACAPVNPSFFGQYNLLNNSFGAPNIGESATSSPIQFNGQTNVLTASSPVVPNRSYNIKLVIADASDGDYDSAVFIEGGSFDISVDLGGSRVASRGNPLCAGENYILDATLPALPGTTLTYSWSRSDRIIVGNSGTEIPGATSPTLQVTEDGFYAVDITFSNGCTANASVRLEFIELPDTIPPDAISCDPAGPGSFDLTIIENIMLSGLNAASYNVTFYESEIDAQNQTNVIPATSNYQGQGNPQTLFVRTEDTSFGCAVIYPFQLIVDDVFAAPVQDIVICDDDNDGVTTTTLADFDDLVAPGYTPGTVTISYYTTQTDADNGTNPLGQTYTNNTSPETLFARVVATNDTGCFDTTSINISVSIQPNVAQNPDDLILCDENNAGDGIEIFDLTTVENDIIGTQNFTDISISYHTSQTDADNNTAAITNPSAFQNTPGGSQTIYLRLENDTSGCFNTSTQFDLIVTQAPAINNPIVYELCDDSILDGSTSFDLNTRINEITGGDLDVSTFFYASQVDATARTNNIPRIYTNTTNPQTIFVIVENNLTGCTNTTTLDLTVRDAPLANAAPDLTLCDSDNTGNLTETFDLTSNESTILNGQVGFNITYHNTPASADDGSNPITNPTSFENSVTPQTIYVRIANNTGCFATTSFDIIVNDIARPQLSDIYYLCLDSNGGIIEAANSPPILDTGLDTSVFNFTWQRDGTNINGTSNATLTATQVGIYTVTITDTATGCTTTQTTEVRQLGPPDNFGAQVTTNYFEERHRIEAFAQGPANQYIFRIDDSPWQYNGNFIGVTPGPHIIVIQDLEGCASVEIPLNVIGYPLYFTPNNDGYHDTWNIIGLNNEPRTIIYIFDRYGKLLKQLDPSSGGWDGTFNGQPLPSSDYWFKVEYVENGIPKSFSGHFTLKK